MLAGYSASNKSTAAEYPARFRMLGAFAGLGTQWLTPPSKIAKDCPTWRLQQLWGILGSHKAEGGLHFRKIRRITMNESTRFKVVRKYKIRMFRRLVCATILSRRITTANLGRARPIIPDTAALILHLASSTVSSGKRECLCLPVPNLVP